MHAIFFGNKRVHLEVVYRVTRPLLDATDCELTPARFDMMRIVHLRKYGVLQRTLQRLLGVSPPTVSRMLKSLEELGMITRGPDTRDGRQRIVRITPRGVVCVEMALAATVGVREAERVVARCATGNDADRRRYHDRYRHRMRVSHDDTAAIIDAAKNETDALDRTLERMRKALSDQAPFHHPWRAFDTMPLKAENPLEPNWNPAPYLTPPWRAPPGHA